jgi:DNA adenine methylase
MELHPVSPTRPLAPWMGGKRNLARTVVAAIENIPHTLYAEPFIGMGGIFFRRGLRPKGEVINDISKDVVTLFRVLQRHYTPFTEMIRWQLASRAEFERLAATDAETLTDLERAARFLYLQRLSFGGKVVKQTFGTVYDGPARFDVTKLMPMLEEVHDRLAGVIIERLAYAEFIRRYDRPGTLFYLDPPYWGNETDYGTGIFSREDFGALAAALKGVKGRFLMSLNDRKEVRECFADFQIRAVKTTYSVAGGKPKAVSEVLISGGGGLRGR